MIERKACHLILEGHYMNAYICQNSSNGTLEICAFYYVSIRSLSTKNTLPLQEADSEFSMVMEDRDGPEN